MPARAGRRRRRSRPKSSDRLAQKPFRVLPRLGRDTEFFWTSGADGRLRFLACTTCGYIVHPPSPICPICRTKTLEPTAVSGRATVATFTINHQPWIPTFDPPYVVAIVEIEEQPSVRLTTNIVGCALDDVYIGMPVEVVFEQLRRRVAPALRASRSCHVSERDAVISGIGQSDIGRRLGLSGSSSPSTPASRPSPTPGSLLRTSTGWPRIRG